jgi:hypothetical protein
MPATHSLTVPTSLRLDTSGDRPNCRGVTALAQTEASRIGDGDMKKSNLQVEKVEL